MTVTVYNSTDVGAPTLSGTPGSLIAVLDACLVNGYGSQTAAGWSKAYAGTNTASYRQGTGNRLYMRIDDSNTTNTRIVGYEVMSGVDTGTGKFPTEGQNSGGLYIMKSNAADSTPRIWTIIATSKVFYLWINNNNETVVPFIYNQLYMFGDILPYKSNDVYHTMIIANNTTGTTSTFSSFVTLNSGLAGHYMARSFTQIGSSVAVGKHSDGIRSGNGFGRGALAFPNVVDGSITLAPVWIHEFNNTQYPIRGIMPGIWNICHTTPLSHGDVFSGQGPLLGKTFITINMYYNSSSCGQCAIETTNNW